MTGWRTPRVFPPAAYRAFAGGAELPGPAAAPGSAQHAGTEIALGSGWASHRWVPREALEEFLPTPAAWEVTAALDNLDAFARFLTLIAQHQPAKDTGDGDVSAADTLVPGGPCLVGPAFA